MHCLALKETTVGLGKVPQSGEFAHKAAEDIKLGHNPLAAPLQSTLLLCVYNLVGAENV